MQLQAVLSVLGHEFLGHWIHLFISGTKIYEKNRQLQDVWSEFELVPSGQASQLSPFLYVPSLQTHF